MQELAKSLGVDHFISFYGRVSDEKLNELYQLSNLFIFTAENQSWGLVPLEAMSYGKPCLVSSGCGVSDILIDKINCIKIKPRDIKAITDNIYLLYKDKKLRESIAISGKEFVLKNFSWKKYAKEMEDIFFQEITNNK